MAVPDLFVSNSESEKQVLIKSLMRSKDREGVIESLNYVLEHHTPFALYIATADRSNCMWVFDPDTVYDMLGGQDIHTKTFRSLFQDDIERSNGILFYVLNKTGPAIVVRLYEETILDVLESLERDVSNHDVH